MFIIDWFKRVRFNSKVKTYSGYYRTTEIHLIALNNLEKEREHNVNKIKSSLEDFKEKFIMQNKKDDFVQIGGKKIKTEDFSYRDIPNREIYKYYGNYFKIHSEMLSNQYFVGLALMIHLNVDAIREHLTAVGDDKESELLTRYVIFLRKSQKLIRRVVKCREKLLHYLEEDNQVVFWETYDRYNNYLSLFYRWYKKYF
jgi:hypothetical protein